MKLRYGTANRTRFVFRSSRAVEKQVDALMRHYGSYTFSALLRSLIFEAYERLPDDEKNS